MSQPPIHLNVGLTGNGYTSLVLTPGDELIINAHVTLRYDITPHHADGTQAPMLMLHCDTIDRVRPTPPAS